MLKHSSIYAIGNLTRQVVGFVMLPVYTRYLNPADYGIVGLLIFMVSLIELIFGARLFHGISKYYYEQKTQRESNAVVSSAILITTVVSVITVLGVIALRVPLSSLMFGTDDHGPLVAVFATLILTQALEYYALGYVRIQQRPWFFIGASTGKLIMQLSLNILLVVVLEWGVMGVVVANVTASVVFTLVMTSYTLWHTGLHFSRRLARQLLIFSWPLWVSGLAGLYVGSSNRYFIRVFADLDQVGLYSLAEKLGTIITLLVWLPFSQYWQTERFSLYQRPDPIPIYQSVFRFISTLLVMAALGVTLFSGPVIRIMAAPEFSQAARAVPYLAFAGVFYSLTVFENFSFLVKEKTGWVTWSSYFTAAVATLLYFSLTPLLGFVGAAQALMLSYGVQFLVVHFAAKWQYDMRLSLKPLSVYLAISAACTVVAFRFEHQDLIQDILIKIMVYTVGCGLITASFLSDANLRAYLASLINLRLFPNRGS